MMDFIPEAQTLLIVVQAVVLLRPGQISRLRFVTFQLFSFQANNVLKVEVILKYV
jgi:hypothetical protein